MYCYKCKKKIDVEKVTFRSCCPYCSFDLHICKNCKYYYVGKPNDCSYPNTEAVADKEKFNFCEEFFPTNEEDKESKGKEEIEEKLFSNTKKEKKNPPDFNSLFKD